VLREEGLDREVDEREELEDLEADEGMLARVLVS